MKWNDDYVNSRKYVYELVEKLRIHSTDGTKLLFLFS